MNYHNKLFRPVLISANGEVTEEVVFRYQQSGNLLTCTYQGGKISAGHLIGLVDPDGKIDMRYHQVNVNGELMTGTCLSTPEILPNGKVRLHEQWRWTSGDHSTGSSTLEEI